MDKDLSLSYWWISNRDNFEMHPFKLATEFIQRIIESTDRAVWMSILSRYPTNIDEAVVKSSIDQLSASGEDVKS